MSAAAAEWAWMAEVASEELANLEAAHPGRFGPLKAELKRLIADPGWDDDAAAVAPVSPDGAAAATCSLSSQSAPPVPRFVSTQESSSRKRRSCGDNGGGGVGEQEGKRRRRAAAAAAAGGMDREEMAPLERAKRCMDRIRALKAWLHRFYD